MCPFTYWRMSCTSASSLSHFSPPPCPPPFLTYLRLSTSSRLSHCASVHQTAPWFFSDTNKIPSLLYFKPLSVPIVYLICTCISPSFLFLGLSGGHPSMPVLQASIPTQWSEPKGWSKTCSAQGLVSRILRKFHPVADNPPPFGAFLPSLWIPLPAAHSDAWVPGSALWFELCHGSRPEQTLTSRRRMSAPSRWELGLFQVSIRAFHRLSPWETVDDDANSTSNRGD